MKFKNFLLRQSEHWPFWLSFLIVVIVSAITVHPDFIVVSKIAEKIANGNLHIYQDLYIGNVNHHIPMMPPLICLIDGFFYFIFKELHLLNFSYNFTDHISSLHLLLLKGRYILIFVLSYPLVYKTASMFTGHDKTLSRRIANLWIASPILLYIPFAQGNNDIYAVVLSLVFLYFAFRKNFLTAMILLGLTAAMKNYALFLIVPVALIFSNKDLKKTALFSLTSALVYSIPALVYSKEMASFVGANNEKFLMLKTAIPSFSVPYSIFAIGYFLILLFLYFGDNIKMIVEEKSQALVTYCFLIMSLFYVTWYFPQWFLWILPFFVFLVYKNKRLYSLYLLISTSYLLYTFVGYPGNLDLNLWKRILPVLTPGKSYFPGVLNSDPTLVTFIVGLFVALFATFVYFLLKDNKPETKSEVIPVYQSYLPAVILLLAITVFSFIAIYMPS